MNSFTKEKLSSRKHHFRFEANDRYYAYVYIRKNACTTWKKFIASKNDANATPDIKTLSKYYRIDDVAKLKQLEKTFVIWRDPLKRFFSAFKNNVIMNIRMSNVEIHNTLLKEVGNPLNISVKRFFYEYFMEKDDEKINCHFWSQVSHLCDDVDYNYWDISSVAKKSQLEFGDEISRKYFLKKTNVSNDLTPFEVKGGSDLTLGNLYSFYKEGRFPTFESLFSDIEREYILSRYELDQKIYDRFSGSSSNGVFSLKEFKII